MNATTYARSVIDTIVGRLVEEYQPEKIILFGSYAYGEPDEDSDIDLLIIKDTDAALLDRHVAVRRIARGAHRRIPLGPLVLTPHEIEQRLGVGDQFIAEILNRGEALYVA